MQAVIAIWAAGYWIENQQTMGAKSVMLKVIYILCSLIVILEVVHIVRAMVKSGLYD